MQILPHSGLAPNWYRSSPLSTNAAQDFPTLIKRLRQFDRDSVALMVSGCLWYAWLHGRHSSELDKILVSNALFIGALGLGTCAAEGRDPLDEASLRILISELFNISSIDFGDAHFWNQEMVPLKEALPHHQRSSAVLRKIRFETDLDDLRRFLTLSRMAWVQWRTFRFFMSDFVRPYLIYEKIRRMALERGHCSEKRLCDAERVFLGTSIERFFRAIWLIFTFTLPDVKSGTPFPKPFETKINYLNPEASKTFDISDSDLEIVAHRLCLRTSEAREKISGVEKLPPNGWLHAKELWLLHEYPLVWFDDKPDKLFLVTSPWQVLRKSVSVTSTELIQYLEENQVLGAKDVAYKLRGEAYEEYLMEIFGKRGVTRIDGYLSPKYQGKKCDFIWEGTKANVLIESKVRLRPNSDQTFFDSRTMIASWEALAEAVEQAAATIKVLPKEKFKPFVLLISTEEALPEEVTQFKRAAKHWKWLDGTGIDAVAVHATSEVEHLIRNETPDSVYENFTRVWNKLNPSDLQGVLVDYDFVSPNREEDDKLPHILAGWEKLIPPLAKAKREGRVPIED